MAAATAVATAVTVVVAAPAQAADLMTLRVGLRPSATRVDFRVADLVDASVDVGTGNLSVLTSDLRLPGIQHDVQLGLAFNSLLVGANLGSGTWSGIAAGWSDRLGNDTRVNANSDGSVSYFGPDGYQGKFTPNGSGGYVPPLGVKASLSGSTGAGWTVTDHASNERLSFAAAGKLTAVTDRNGQATTFGYSAGKVTTVTSTRSGTTSRVANLTYDANGRLKRVSQSADSTGSRSVTYTYSSGRLTGIVDAAGRTTTFGYTPAGGGDDLTSISNTGGAATTFSYDSAHRVTKVSRGNPGGTDAATRFQYPTTGSDTLVAGPNTDQSQPVSAVPHTTYTVDGNALVTAAQDPLNRTRSASYTPLGDVATATTAGGGTTSTEHAANGGESLTKVTSPMGATVGLSYTGSGAAQYLPTGGTDTQGNPASYLYDSLGNPQSGSNTASGASASVTYHGDGTLATSTNPAGQVSTYTVNAATHQVTQISPPAGSGLGATSLGYDGYGRLQTVTDARGAVTTYSYDDLDRVTGVSFTGGGAGAGAAVTAIAYTFDTAGNLTRRVDGTGTTSYGYDGLGRLTSRTDGAAVTVGYRYDPASNLTSSTNALGTTSYGYDAANQLTTRTGPGGATDRYTYNADGRRTDTYWRSTPGSPPTTFAAHTHTDYDAAGRVARTWTSRTSSDATKVFDTSYCYATAQPCPTGASTGDKGLIQWSTDNLTGARSTYTYDGANRLTDVTGWAGHTYRYGYDVGGNRATVTVDGTTTQSLTFNTGSNQITSTGYGYDAAGNLTSDPATGTLTYNKAGQLDTRATATTYQYAGAGQAELTHEVTPAATWDYSYGRTDRYGLPTLESVKKNGDTTYLGNDPTTGKPQQMTLPSGQDDYLVTDARGTVVAMIANTGNLQATYSYDPYGTVTNVTNVAGSTAVVAINVNPYGHTGGIIDPSTSWTRHGTRYNDTTTGRWTTQDPITRLANPDRDNPYTYAGDNPINYIDPTGRCSTLDITSLTAGVAFFLSSFEAAEFGLAVAAGVALELPVGGLILGTVGTVALLGYYTYCYFG